MQPGPERQEPEILTARASRHKTRQFVMISGLRGGREAKELLHGDFEITGQASEKINGNAVPTFLVLLDLLIRYVEVLGYLGLRLIGHLPSQANGAPEIDIEAGVCIAPGFGRITGRSAAPAHVRPLPRSGFRC